MTNESGGGKRTGWTKRDVHAVDEALPLAHDGLDEDAGTSRADGARGVGQGARRPHGAGGFDAETIARHAEMLVNRVKKSRRKLGARMERDAIGAYRLYDRDIPEVRVVVDWYEGHVVVAEYEREQTGDAYLPELARVLGEALGLPETHVHARRRHTRALRGPRNAPSSSFTRLVVREGSARFAVRLGADADTGLFPHLRTLRTFVAEESAGRRVLDLFAYTGTHAASAMLGGADEVTSVDPSQLHLDWAAENYALNGLDLAQHPLLRDDVRAFLADAGEAVERWDLAVLDTSSFSVRLGAEGEPLDVLRDHRALIVETLAVLDPGGVLWFATSHQRFVPDLDGLRARDVQERTADTVPEDYRNREVHRSWRITK